MKRKMLAASEDLVNEVLKIANRKNVKLFGMINEILELVIRTEGMGLSFEEVVNQFGIVKAAKDAGFIPIVENLWYEVIEKILQVDKKWVIKKWYESGQWYGKYYSVKLPQEPLTAFKKEIEAFTWNVSEFRIVENKEKDEVSVSCISPRFPISQTTIFAAFLEGALDTFGYDCTKKQVSKGIIQLSFRKRDGAQPV